MNGGPPNPVQVGEGKEEKQMANVVWQIASGEAGRFYTDLFLKHDIMCLGPGDFQPFDKFEDSYKNAVETGLITNNKFNQIKNFMDGPQAGDIIILRRGLEIVHLGVIPNNKSENQYFWCRTLDDVFGWDLQHTRRVIWQDSLSNELKKIEKENDLFKSRKQIHAFTRVKDPIIHKPIEHMFEKVEFRKLRGLPNPIPNPLDLEKIGSHLFAKGLSNDSVDKVVSLIERQRRLVNWYDSQVDKTRPTEHEVVAYLVLPLLLSLGWSEQLLAVEWKKIDLAAFISTPTIEDNCVVVCEAKIKGHGLKDALEQAKNYVIDRRLNHAKKIILTDGVRIYIHQRDSNEDWRDKPCGYINLMKIRTKHLVPENTNAINSLIALTPANISRPISRTSE